MTTFWTIMVVTFGAGPFEGFNTYIPFSNKYICGENILAVREQLELDGLEVKMVRCVETDMPSMGTL